VRAQASAWSHFAAQRPPRSLPRHLHFGIDTMVSFRPEAIGARTAHTTVPSIRARLRSGSSNSGSSGSGNNLHLPAPQALPSAHDPLALPTSSAAAAAAAAVPPQAGTLPFSLEDIEQAFFRSSPAAAESDYDPSSEIARLRAECAPAAGAHAALAAAVAAVKAAHGAAELDAWALGCELAASYGYQVQLRTSLGPKHPKSYLRSLRHSFLVVRPAAGAGCAGGGGCGGAAGALVEWWLSRCWGK